MPPYTVPDDALSTELYIKIEHESQVKDPLNLVKSWLLSNLPPLPDGIISINTWRAEPTKLIRPKYKNSVSEVYLGKVEPFEPKKRDIPTEIIQGVQDLTDGKGKRRGRPPKVKINDLKKNNDPQKQKKAIGTSKILTATKSEEEKADFSQWSSTPNTQKPEKLPKKKPTQKFKQGKMKE